MAATRSAILLLSVLCLCGLALAKPSSRLLEGEDVAVGGSKFTVSVRLDNAHVAGGSIISGRHILTAAHALSEYAASSVNPNRVSVRAGSINQFAGGVIYKVQAINIHPSYGNFLHDICILTLAAEMPLTGNIDKIAYAKAPVPSGSEEENNELPEGTVLSVSGWGLQKSGASPYKLQTAQYSVLSAANCEYEAGYGYESVLCMKHNLNEGIARGDGGSGVVHDNTLVGVVSFCFGSGGTKYPDISSNVAYYSDWIDAIVA